jgi:hypothetical protein
MLFTRLILIAQNQFGSSIRSGKNRSEGRGCMASGILEMKKEIIFIDLLLSPDHVNGYPIGRLITGNILPWTPV